MSQSPQALFLSVVAPTAPAPRLTPAPAQPPASTPPATPAPESTIPAPQTQEEKPVEFEVVAEEAGEYNVPDASTATKTDTPLRQIPQSIQVVPRQMI